MVLEQNCFLTDPTKIYEPILSKVEVSFEDQFKNEYGAIRQRFVKEAYDLNMVNEDTVNYLFTQWRDDPEFFILKGKKPYFVPYVNNKYFDSDSGGETFYKEIYKCFKASKRGNDIYRYLVGEKLKPLEDLENVSFFDPQKSLDRNTSLLFITLTYDTSLGSVKHAWENIGIDFHRFLSNMRKQYGHIEVFRTWESTKHYYPHVHCIIAFKKKSFSVFVHTDKNSGKRTFRIPYKTMKKISSYWHSHVDIQGVDSSGGAIKELTKYITKDLCSDKGNKTNSMIWLFRKQSYSVTKHFLGLIRGCFNEVVDLNEPKATDLLKDKMSHLNSGVEKWEFVGVVRGVSLGVRGDIWCITYEDPPPKVKDLFEHEQERWGVSRVG